MALEGVDAGLMLMREVGWSWHDLCHTPHSVVMEMLALVRLQRELSEKR